jgi:hypothetical protein
MSPGDRREIYANTEKRKGYMHINSLSKLNIELLQEVAGYGMEAINKDEMFPKWKYK